jgi:2-amino-4-hydroxy-6-hydroxymethyldihydropteridine diphosphokinase
VSKVYLHLGSNIGDRKGIIDDAIKLIGSQIGKIRAQSNTYETEPWGVHGQDDYLNVAVLCETYIKPMQILAEIQKIESTLGRIRTAPLSPRTIDIDILMIDRIILNDKLLVIPHPKISERNFVLIPLMEIAGDVELPGKQKTIEELYEECKDPCEVRVYEN